jgi:hypothetical protein
VSQIALSKTRTKRPSLSAAGTHRSRSDTRRFVFMPWDNHRRSWSKIVYIIIRIYAVYLPYDPSPS